MNLVSRYMQGYIQKVCRGGRGGANLGNGAQNYKNLRRGGGGGGGGARMTAPPSCYIVYT